VPSLSKLSRADLEKKATAAGVADVGDRKTFPNRQALIDAIEARSGEEAAADNPFGPSAKVVSVFGPFNSRCLLDVPADIAVRAFGQLDEAARTNTIDAVDRDLAAIRERDPDLADSALAAVAVRLAYELEHPFNSATSKAQCAKALNETLDRLRELAPDEEEEKDKVDRLAAEREKRIAGTSDPAD
jgi:hypothetical protein